MISGNCAGLAVFHEAQQPGWAYIDISTSFVYIDRRKNKEFLKKAKA